LQAPAVAVNARISLGMKLPVELQHRRSQVPVLNPNKIFFANSWRHLGEYRRKQRKGVVSKIAEIARGGRARAVNHVEQLVQDSATCFHAACSSVGWVTIFSSWCRNQFARLRLSAAAISSIRRTSSGWAWKVTLAGFVSSDIESILFRLM
jgi:hypothetical protein